MRESRHFFLLQNALAPAFAELLRVCLGLASLALLVPDHKKYGLAHETRPMAGHTVSVSLVFSTVFILELMTPLAVEGCPLKPR